MKRLLALVVSLSVLMVGAPAGSTTAAPLRVRPAFPELTPAPDDALTRALEAGDLGEAEYALERALSLFAPKLVARRFGDVAPLDQREATFVLRDLVLRRHNLRGEDRATADAVVARPTDDKTGDPVNIKYGGASSKRICTTDLCVHYVKTGTHKVNGTDANDNGTPDYVETVTTVLQDQVWSQEIDILGFRPPKGDLNSTNNGGNDKIDFYLAQIGDIGLYGYCTSDDPNINGAYRFSDMSAYCVLDNDYKAAEFPNQSPINNLQVTGAHEFFHAVQFAYDFFEDLWILENTATWIEDEVYDDLDDNLQFLNPTSAMRTPRVPLDFAGSDFEYGNFIFWKYLSERFGRGVVKQVWNRADGAKGGEDMYSLKATRSVLDKRSAFGKVFTGFGLANFLPSKFYEEGARYAKATGGGAPATKKFTLGKFNRRSPRVPRRLDHLTSSYYLFKPGKGVGPGDRLKLNIDGPGIRSKPKATLVALDGSKIVAKKSVRLSSRGIGRSGVTFDKVTRVLLLLSNASTRYKGCFTDFLSPFSCAGHPVDQNKSFTFRAKLKT